MTISLQLEEINHIQQNSAMTSSVIYGRGSQYFTMFSAEYFFHTVIKGLYNTVSIFKCPVLSANHSQRQGNKF